MESGPQIVTLLEPILAVSTFSAAFGGAALALWIAARGSGRGPRGAPDATAPLALLFHDGVLADADPDARRLFDLAPDAPTDLDRLLAAIGQGVPGLADEILAAPGGRPVEVPGGTVRLWRVGDALRVEIRPSPGTPPVPAPVTAALDRARHAARAEADASPIPLWRQAGDRVTWSNAAYRTLAADTGAGPHGPLFPADSLPASDAPTRATVGGRTFDCLRRPAGIFAAIDVTATARAERRLRDFTRTLARTFAEIDIGLALFDERRRLVLFNPAVTDLFGVPFELLARHPSIEDFFDGLREAGKVPEPKDYARWRDRLTSTRDGGGAPLLETWTMADGQMLRVIRRPHSDGAVVFLFEDITPEVTLSRRFRQELDTAAGVLDALDEAVAAISPGGILTLTNSAYVRLWGTDPATSPSDVGLAEATGTWAARCHATPLWDRIRGFAAEKGRRRGFSASARLTDGRELVCRVAPMAGGGSLILFRPPVPLPLVEVPRRA